MRAKLSESRPDSRSLRSSDSGDSFLCCSRATCSNSDVMVARSDISAGSLRSEEHTSELQSQSNLVCRLLLEKKKNHPKETRPSHLPRVPHPRPCDFDRFPQR